LPTSGSSIAIEPPVSASEETASYSRRSEATAEGRDWHVGYFLIDNGLPQLEQSVKARLSAGVIIRRIAARFPLLFYVGAIVLITAVLAGGLLKQARLEGLAEPLLALVAIVSTLSASHLAVALVNWLVTLFAKPHALPTMDFSKGVPSECRTLVVVPTMITSKNNVENLVEGLEVRFLANQDEAVQYALLTDLRDADRESLPEDEPLLLLAQQRIAELNDKYRMGEEDPFFLFHRPRRWNPAEKIWMGYERKRGKLADLNALLRGDAGDRFSLVVQCEIRHYSGHRHATAARFCQATDCGHGAPAESSAL
jgi:hypothetical protein